MTLPSHSAAAATVSRAPSPRQREPGWNAFTDTLCHLPKPRPGRRRRGVGLYQQTDRPAFRRRRIGSGLPWTSMQSWVIVVLLSVLLCCGRVEAGPVHGHGRRGLRRGELVVDTRESPVMVARLRQRGDGGGYRRGQNASETSGNGELQVADQGNQIPLPRPFDTSLGNNFTTSTCPTFFNDFLTNATFNECLPFSLLLQTSNSFFSTSRSFPRLTSTLDAACSVPYPKCAALMSSLAQQIQSSSTCGPDLALENPMVTQAYNGFIAYAPLYQAGCLRDPTTQDYCFASAVTNASAPTSSYIYYLALGVALPGGTQPTCNSCLQRTMDVFSTYAANSSQPLSEVYGTAAQQLDMTCGPTFVEANVVVASGDGATLSRHAGVGMVVALVVGLWAGF